MNTLSYREIKYKGLKRTYFVGNEHFPRVREMDAYNVMWHGNYIDHFEEARMLLFRSCDLDLEKFLNLGIIFTIHNLNITYRIPIKASTPFRVAIRPHRLEKGIMEFEELILVQDKIHAQARIEAVLVDKDQGIPLGDFPEFLYPFIFPILKNFPINEIKIDKDLTMIPLKEFL